MTVAERAFAWAKDHRWWVALIIVVIAGYSLGKDIAQRDNAREASAQVQGA